MTRTTSDKYAGITADQIRSCENDLSQEHLVVLLASLDGGYRAIAAALDVKIGTVKSRLNRARTALAKALMAIETRKPEADQ